MKNRILENIYDIINNNIDEIKVNEGVNIYYTKNNKIFIETNDSIRLFEITIKEVKEVK